MPSGTAAAIPYPVSSRPADWPSGAGIYRILNTVSGKSYVGSTVRMRGRWTEHRHRLRKGNHHSRHLQSSWNKYGEDCFVFEPLLFMDAEQPLFVEEQRFIDSLDAFRDGYNTLPAAGSALGHKASPEARAKMSAAALGRPPSIKNYTHTPEARAAMSLANRGKGTGPEACESRRKAQQARSRLSAAEVLDIYGRASSGTSRKALAEEYGVRITTVNSICRGDTWSSVTGATGEGIRRRRPRAAMSEDAKAAARKVVRASRSPLDEDSVREIRRRYAAGENQPRLAREYKVSEPTISNIVCRRTWADIE